MPRNPKVESAAGELMTHSLLYRQAQAQTEEILKHKWYQSEKAGHDIGFERAQIDWIIRYRSEWLRHWRKKKL